MPLNKNPAPRTILYCNDSVFALVSKASSLAKPTFSQLDSRILHPRTVLVVQNVPHDQRGGVLKI